MNTDNKKTHTDDFDGFFTQAQREMEAGLPKEITETYNVLSSISETNLHSSFLLEDRKQHFRVVLKTGTKDSISLLKTEAELGEKVRNALSETDGRVISYQEISGTGYLLRQYIEGMNLMEYVERRSILTADEIYEILHILCHKISILHKLNPPIIHRDIKPENIIIRAKKGRILDVYIIDYGTARMYDEYKEHDTVFVGTRQTAAPEQYGFSQTDERTDIYGLGKVLCYMLSGDFDEDKLKNISRGMLRHMQLSIGEYHSLRRAVHRSTYLDPTRRYASVRQFQIACRRGNKLRYFWKALILSLLVMLMIGGAFVAGTRWERRSQQTDNQNGTDVNETRNTTNSGDYVENDQKDDSLTGNLDGGNSQDNDVSDSDAENTADVSALDGSNTEQVETDGDGSVVFESDLLKEAVLKNLPAGTVITKDTLSKVRSIRIIGKNCFGYESEIWSYKDMVFVDGSAYPNSDVGDVTDLSLIAAMDNLEELYLANQNLKDISGLAGCPVETLFLNGNQIEDFSVLETMPNLRNLYIGNNPISEIPDLSKCKKLRMLNLDHLFVNDIKPLAKLNLYELEMLDIRVLDNDYSPLKEVTTMYRLTVGEPESGMVDVVGELTSITDLSLDSWPEDNIEKIFGMTKLEVFSVSSEYLDDIHGIEKLSNMKRLYLDGSTRITDVSGIEKLNYLQEFSTNSSMIVDVTPICSLSDNVTMIRLSNAVADKVLEKRPDYKAKIYINY